MTILYAIVSLPISIIIIWWLTKCKQEPHFAKGNVRRLVIAGIISAVAAFIIMLVIVVVRAVNSIGLDTLRSWVSNPDPASIQTFIEQSQAESEDSFWSLFLFQIFSVGFVEELSRYFFLRLATRKQAFAKTWLDFVICGGIVGTGFSILEDMLYSSGGILVAVMRALMPFHFTYGAIMGFFIGKAVATGRKSLHIPAILIPVLLHAFYDSSIDAAGNVDDYAVLAAASLLLMVILTIFMIVKIRRWARQETGETGDGDLSPESADI